MRPLRRAPAVARFRPHPDEPGAIVAPRPAGSRRPHRDATVAAVRRLVEGTALTYGEISARTGVARASICRWTRDGGWKRHLFAPRATDTVPTVRARARLKARTLAARLHALAERHIRALEATPDVDADKLAEALELLKMAKLAARPKRRRKRCEAGNESRTNSSDPPHPGPLPAGAREPTESAARPDLVSPDSAPSGAATERAGATLIEQIHARLTEQRRAGPLAELRAAGVDVERAPRAAVEDFVESRTPPRELPPDDPALRRRGHRSRRNREHAWLLERDES